MSSGEGLVELFTVNCSIRAFSNNQNFCLFLIAAHHLKTVALQTLLVHLPPRDRVTLLLKDIFDYSLDEITPTQIPQNLVDSLVKTFNNSDMDGMISLFLEHASGEVYGTVQEWSRDEIRRGKALSAFVEALAVEVKAIFKNPKILKILDFYLSRKRRN